MPEPQHATSDRMVETPHGTVHVTHRAGQSPAVVLLHGFPDDSRIYDRLLPFLAPRELVAVDWVGYGRSERIRPYPRDISDHPATLRAVLDALDLTSVALVAHDASGPDAINFVLSEPNRAGHLILLDTYYGHPPVGGFPEVIRLLADPALEPLADAMMDDPGQRRWLLAHTARQFGLDPGEQGGVGAVSIAPQFFGGADQPDALAAIRAWTGRLLTMLEEQDARVAAGELARLDVPVTVVAGAHDSYLSPDLAGHLAGLLGRAEVQVVEGASHWPQWDQPQAVARLVTAGPPS